MRSYEPLITAAVIAGAAGFWIGYQEAPTVQSWVDSIKGGILGGVLGFIAAALVL